MLNFFKGSASLSLKLIKHAFLKKDSRYDVDTLRKH
jgi:hypothetical protein